MNTHAAGRSSLYTLTGFKAAFALAHLLPRAAAQWLAPRIGLASFRRNAAGQAALRANLQLVTGLAGEKLEALCEKNVANFSRMLADYFLCAGVHASRHANALLEAWSGREHLAAARARGKGAMIVTGHLGHWELGGILLARLGLPLTIVTLEEPSTDLTRWREASRRHCGIRTITVGPGHPFSFVEMIQTLRRNELLAMLVDRPYAATGTPVEFFGQPAAFSSAPALLAEHTGAAVIPAFVLRETSGRYVSLAEPPVFMDRTGASREAIGENTQRLASAFESVIRQHPEQWFNYVPIWSAPAS